MKIEIELGRGKIELSVGDRILYEIWGEDELKEGRIEEISPTEKYIKIDGQWYRKYDIKVKEVL